MAEVAFAKQFLTTLDTFPTKLASDHVADPTTLPAQPAFILPRMPKSLSKRAPNTTSSAPSGSTTITLKPVRATHASHVPVTLSGLASGTTSIYDVKVQLGQRTGYAPEKLKLLWEKKPVADSKTLRDVLGDGRASAELGVMFVGLPVVEPVAKQGANAELRDVEMKDDETPVAQGKSGLDVMKTTEFWDDLQAFMLQRVRDEHVAQDAVRLWKESWKENGR